MQQSDAESDSPNGGEGTAFALDFRADSVALMRRECGVATMARGRRFALKNRPGGAWSEIAKRAWLPPTNGGSPDILDPDGLRAVLADQAEDVDIWLPNGLLLSRTVEDPGQAGPEEPAEDVAARAITGLTILRPDALEMAATRAPDGIAVRAVEKAVLKEVCAHARRWGFGVRSVRSRPGDAAFPDGAVFLKQPLPESYAPAGGAEQARKAGIGSLALIAVGCTAALFALGLFLVTTPPEPGILPDADVAATSPAVAPEPNIAAPAVEASPPGAPDALDHATADSPPSYERLSSEVAYSAPADQFPPSATAPAAPAEPPADQSATLPEAPATVAEIAPFSLEVADAPAEAPPPPPESEGLAPPRLIDPPVPPDLVEARSIAASAPLQTVSVDPAAGEPSEAMAAPEDAPAIEGAPTQPDAGEPVAETPSDPPDRLPGLEELGEQDYAALSVEEAPTPLAPPGSMRDRPDPAPVPRPAFRPTDDPDAPLVPAGEDDAPPLSERAPEQAPTPRPRSSAVATAAEADQPVEVTTLAPQRAVAPRPRPAAVAEMPAKLAAAAERARAERNAAAAKRRAAPSAEEIAATATQQMEWETLDGFMVIGLFERVEGRSALMRLPNGDVRRVKSGDRIGRWTVTSVERASVGLTYEGRSQTLRMPGVN